MEREEVVKALAEAFLDRKTDSIAISKGMAGKMSWDVKIYSDNLLKPENAENVINRLKEINNILKANFGSGGDENGK